MSLSRECGADARLRIALVTETFPPEVNGVAMTLGKLAEGLRSRDHAVQIVRPRQPRHDSQSIDDGDTDLLVRGLPIPGYGGLRFGLPATAALRRAWQRRRPDVVHIATEGPLGWSALRAARSLALPITSSFHTNFDAYSSHYRLGWLKAPIARYLRRVHNATELTFVPTQGLAGELHDSGYCNVEVLSRGVDIRLFNPARRSESLRARWGAGPGDLVVAYVGRLAPEKNLGLVLAAFAAITQVRPDARLVFVGDGPLRRSLAARHTHHVFAGMRRGVELAEHYASVDLFLFPSLTETFGNVTAEALASGLGVVAYDCAAAADLIEDGSNGCLAAPGDEAAFIDAAVSLAAQPDQLGLLRALAAPSVRHLDWERIHDDFAEGLRRGIEAHRRNHAETVLVPALD
ncbi:MAG: glycosyltransferase family 4 protein [Ignavibacteria bacterium]